MPTPELFLAILAGGPGSRLWPLSRALHPKFLIELVPGRPSTLVDTYQRCIATADPSRVLVVTGSEHVQSILEALPALTADQVIAEPCSRDSLAALALVSCSVVSLSPDAVLVTVPADNFADDPDRFVSAVHEAVVTAGTNYICTVGLRPAFPSTAHGYIEVADTSDDQPGGMTVVSFTEKPKTAVAERYVGGGRHLWNAGIFVGRASNFVTALRRHHPDVLRAATSVLAGDATAWRRLERLSIDHGIAEPEAAAGRMRVVAADFGFRDVGDVAALVDDSPDDMHVRIDSDGTVIRSSGGRVIAVLGVPGVVVVDTPDAVLVTTPDHADRVRSVIEELRARGRDDLT